MSRRQIARDAVDQIRFRLRGATDAAVNVLLDRVLAGIKGQRVVDLSRMTPDVLAGILPRVYPQMLAVVREHQDAGRPCYIATAASQPAAEILAEALVMDGAMGTRWEIEDGVYTGRLDGPFAYGEGKAQRLREFAARAGHRPRSSRGRTPTRPRTCRCSRRSATRWPSTPTPSSRRSHAARAGRCCASRSWASGCASRPRVAVAAAVGGSGSWLAARRRAGSGAVASAARRRA